MLNDLTLITAEREYFDWKNVAESLYLWTHQMPDDYRWWADQGHFYCAQADADAPLLWAFLDRGHTTDELLSELNEVWPRLQPGGILAGHDYLEPHWVDVVPTVDAWAEQHGLEVHFAAPHSFWVQKPGGSFPPFRIWNHEVATRANVEHKFNPTICPHPHLPHLCLYAFRSNEGRWDRGRIWIGEVDGIDLQFIFPPQQLDLETGKENCEDPRLFLWDGEIWLGYASSDWEDGPTISRQHLVKLRKTPAGVWETEGPSIKFASPLGRRQEKNWTFFPRNPDDLMVHYSSEPEWRVHQVFMDSPNEYIPSVIAPGIHWPFGQIRGGSPFFEAPNGRWWSFFHSSCWHQPVAITIPFSYYNGVFPPHIAAALTALEVPGEVPPHPRYFCGLLEMDPTTLLPTRISSQPLLYQTWPTPGRNGGHVTWPAGAFRVGDEITLAYGLDDRTCHCARFSAALLERLLVTAPTE